MSDIVSLCVISLIARYCTSQILRETCKAEVVSGFVAGGGFC